MSDEPKEVILPNGERAFWNGREWISESEVFGVGAGGNPVCRVCGGYDQHKGDCPALHVSLPDSMRSSQYKPDYERHPREPGTAGN